VVRGQAQQELLGVRDQPRQGRAHAEEVVEVEQRGLTDGDEPPRPTAGLEAEGQGVLEGLRRDALGHALGEPALRQREHARGGVHHGFGPQEQFAQASHGARL
jgi:hypothetical protein